MKSIVDISIKSFLLLILTFSLAVVSKPSVGQVNFENLPETNESEMYVKANMFVAEGKKEKAAVLLRSLISRFPGRAITTIATNMLETLDKEISGEDQSEKLARQKKVKDQADSDSALAKRVDEANKDMEKSRAATSAAWGQAFAAVGGAVIERNARRAEVAEQRKQELIAQQQRQAQIDQQQKAEYDRMAQQRLAMANQIASNENAAPTAAKINRDEADAALQRRLAQDTLRIAGPSGLKDNGSGPQRRNDERPNDTRGGLTKGDSWGAEDTRKLAREAAERDRQNEIAKQDYWRRRNEEVTRQAAVDEKKWHKDMGDMKRREDEAANAIIRAENAEVNNPNIIKVTSRCSGGIVVVINSYASTTALRGKVSYRVTATDSSGEKIDETGYWTYVVGPGSYTDNSAEIKADCSKAWKLQVTDNRWWAAR